MEETNKIMRQVFDNPKERQKFYEELAKRLVDDPDFTKILSIYIKEFRISTIVENISLIDIREMIRNEVEKTVKPIVEKLVHSLDKESLSKIASVIFAYDVAKAVAEAIRVDRTFLKEVISQSMSNPIFMEKLAAELAEYATRFRSIRDSIVNELVQQVVEKIKKDEKLMQIIYERTVTSINPKTIANQIMPNYEIEKIIKKQLINDETFKRQLYEEVKTKLIENAEYYASQLSQVLYNILKDLLKNDTALHAQMYQKIVRELERRLKQ